MNTIDDPVGITIRQTEEMIDEESYLPMRLAKLGLSAGFAELLWKWPAIVQIVTSFLTTNSDRLQRRFLIVAKELNEQQKRIEEKIPDKKYYESEEFHTLFSLVLERLNTAHDEEKLRMFGDALANSGSIQFASDDKEEYIRTLRELSSKDLRTLNSDLLKGWTPHVHEIKYDPDTLSSLSRLEGMGLVIQHFKAKSPRASRTGSPRTNAELVMQDLLTSPPMRTYALSPFGERFLEFVAIGSVLKST
jgi:hypothetical protein